MSMLLSSAIFLPIFLGLLTCIFGRDRHQTATKIWAVFSGLLVLGLTLFITYVFFNANSHALAQPSTTIIHNLNTNFKLVEQHLWLPQFQIKYYLGVDGISIFLLPLTALITLLISISAWKVIEQKIAYYHGFFLILCGLTIGAFTSLDGALFYLFFEASLIPMYLIIGIWGGPRRVYAAFKFFLYTLLGSLLSLIAMVYLYSKSNSFDILVWQQLPLTAVEQSWIFIAFFLAFAVKVPMWPFHTWLPDAHVEAPTGGSMLLAALMLKLGTYGFLRFILPIAPDASHTLAPWMIALSLIAIIYIGLVALVQTDMKKLVAYSSIAHMGFVTLGIFTFQSMGMTGAVVQMISHGFISAGMFFCIGVLYDRVHSREMADYGGVAHVMPKFATFALILAMANCGLPITSGFVGELLVLMATAKISFLLAFLAGLSLILSAAYSLWMYKKVCFGKITHQHVAVLKDINAREFTVLLILVALVFFMGIYPKPFTDLINPAVSELAAHVSKTKLILK